MSLSIRSDRASLALAGAPYHSQYGRRRIWPHFGLRVASSTRERVSRDEVYRSMIATRKLTVGVALVLIPIMGACAGQDASEAAAGVPTFQADPNWPLLPADFEWGLVIGIVADSRGHVWTSSSSEIAEWDPEGNLVQSWNARGPDGSWRVIHGLFVDHNDYVWTNARESHLTIKFTREGEHPLTIGRQDESGGSNDPTRMGRPSDIWVDPVDNEVFIADGYPARGTASSMSPTGSTTASRFSDRTASS